MNCLKVVKFFFVAFVYVSAFCSVDASADWFYAELGAPYHTPDGIRATGSSVDEVVTKTVTDALSAEALARYNIKPGECGYNLYTRNEGELVAEILFNGRCGGGARIYGTEICPEGSAKISWNQCEIKFDVAVDDARPPTSCAQQGGNPLDLGTGAK